MPITPHTAPFAILLRQNGVFKSSSMHIEAVGKVFNNHHDFRSAGVPGAGIVACDVNSPMHNNLRGSNLIATKFGSASSFANSDVYRALFIGTEKNGKPITKELLEKEGARNTNWAFYTAEDLKKAMKEDLIPPARATAYLQTLNAALECKDLTKEQKSTLKECAKLFKEHISNLEQQPRERISLSDSEKVEASPKPSKITA